MREIIKTLSPYDPTLKKVSIDLHANEVNQNLNLMLSSQVTRSINRYPDHQGSELKKYLSNIYGYNLKTLIIGSGSSEILELMVKTFVDKDDVVLSFDPTFVMYEQYTRIAGGIYQSVPYSNHSLEDLYQASLDLNPKLIFISNPNNPTGSYFEKSEILNFIKRVSCPVVIDEAYIEYVNESKSLASEIHHYDNLYVTRTFSKAFALAGARLGYCVTQEDNLLKLKRAKTPYSVSTLSLALGVEALKQKNVMETLIKDIIDTKAFVYEALKKLKITVFKSYTNFIYLFEPNKDLYQLLLNQSILIRSYENGYYRMSIGTQKEMEIVIQTLKEIYDEKN